MKTPAFIPILMGLCVAYPIIAHAQFTSGSTGTLGALNVTENTTLDMPPDGIFHYTTITVASGATLKFNRNALNTPVYLLATGDVVINGTIDVSGSGAQTSIIPGVGGPGGFDGGFGRSNNDSILEGHGQGPGGGVPGTGATSGPSGGGGYGASTPGNMNAYGNTLISPLIGGSGGAGGGNPGGGYGAGAGGGGAILIASPTLITVNGSIWANGGSGGFGGGSGGGIRLVAPVVNGTGELRASGGFGYYKNSFFTGSGGRTRIDTLDRVAWRTLKLGSAGKWTTGTQMFVFPPGNPKLDIISAAGTAVPEGASAPVAVTLPVGSPTEQIIRVQARGFTADIPIRVKVTPENAPSATFDGVILQSSGNPPFADVPVTLPVDTVCHIHAWTR